MHYFLKRYFLSACSIILLFAGSVFAQSYDTCAHLKIWESIKPSDAATAKLIYDSLRIYIKKCAASDDQSYAAFTPLDGAVPLYAPKDTSRYAGYREWLISVLYLNTSTPIYFCRCLRSIAGTYQYGKYYSTNAGIAIFRYLRNNPQCNGQAINDIIKQDSLYLLQNGLDTTIPSLDSLGLGFLLTHESAAPSNSWLSDQYIASLTSSPNPFQSATNLRFELSRMSYVMIEVYDLLGNKVYGNGARKTYEAGSYEVALDGKSLPHGTLYARIATGFGEVKTVKLVHEK
jgi:hypothetical protein